MTRDSDDSPAHDAGTGRGEEKSQHLRESGRYDDGESDAERPSGHSTMRDATGINAEDRKPIDPGMPQLIPA